MDVEAAHLEELRVARRLDDPRRVMPVVPAGCRRVLDIGCGAGQTLIGADVDGGVMACGVDRDVAALQLGRRITDRVRFVCALGESLPFRSESFDFVISRVALPYMHVPAALTEIRRVLVPGGRLWLVLHPGAMVLRELMGALRARRAKSALGRLWVLGNGVTLHCFGRIFRIPFTRARWESFQTPRGMRRALRAGFDETEISRGRFFVVTARRSA
ncbi:MAG: hypothetical protein DME15_10080 [Candidatus Rokuibacteriota bacterium]|nr:MAG: hypothetical protein DME15_10080 [Candidatus Rokubacteria bacterium]